MKSIPAKESSGGLVGQAVFLMNHCSLTKEPEDARGYSILSLLLGTHQEEAIIVLRAGNKKSFQGKQFNNPCSNQARD